MKSKPVENVAWSKKLEKKDRKEKRKRIKEMKRMSKADDDDDNDDLDEDYRLLKKMRKVFLFTLLFVHTYPLREFWRMRVQYMNCTLQCHYIRMYVTTDVRPRPSSKNFSVKMLKLKL